MPIEANKLIMPPFYRIHQYRQSGVSRRAWLISPNARFYVPGRLEPLQGPAGYLTIIGMMRGGFPDIQWTLEEMIAEGDKVAARFTCAARTKALSLVFHQQGRKSR